MPWSATAYLGIPQPWVLATAPIEAKHVALADAKCGKFAMCLERTKVVQAAEVANGSKWEVIVAINTLDGRNPAPITVIGSLCHDLQVFYIPFGVGFLPSTVLMMIAPTSLWRWRCVRLCTRLATDHQRESQVVAVVVIVVHSLKHLFQVTSKQEVTWVYH